MRKRITVNLFLILLILSSCSSSLPDTMPDSVTDIDELELNTYIRVTAPQVCNTGRSGKSVCLKVENLSNEEWTFDVSKDILIFRYENKEWKNVPNKIIQIGDTILSLGTKNDFPSDQRVIDVLPDVNSSETVELRIFIIVHELTVGKPSQSKGGFVDLSLGPSLQSPRLDHQSDPRANRINLIGER